ncbi:MAG: FAD-dependent oxidoreductase [Phycisphaerales bacterium]|nr:FAD-dependent oxidoreductase [Phycisphaerales bacterium]
MKNDSGASTSVWMATADMPEAPPLTADASADVCVVGAGIAGISTAYLLAREGRSVILIDDGPLAGGETSRTSAHLTCVLDDQLHVLERIHGVENARLAVQAHAAAIDRIETLSAELGIKCDFERVDGYLFCPPDQDRGVLEKELEAYRRIGWSGVEMVDRAPFSMFDTGPCLKFADQAMFHPLKYVGGLVKALTELGARVHCRTHAAEFKSGSPAHVRTREGHLITAGSVVVATNTPVNDRVTMHTKQAAYRTYCIGARLPRGSVPRGLYWDTADPYHYVRVQPVEQADLPPDARDEHDRLGHDILIVGGEDHKTGQADDFEDRFHRLIEWTRSRFPMVESIDFRWSGQTVEPVDHLAFIGENPGFESRNIYIVTGDSGHGLTHGTIAGMLLTDLIAGRDNPWRKIYDPSRRTLRTIGGWARENANAFVQYADWAASGEVSSEDEIPRGEGAILRSGLTKVACYKDEQGQVSRCSAMCTHLGGQVNWNSAEKTWDCPVHGSRFDCRGSVINGPAIANLGIVREKGPTPGREADRRGPQRESSTSDSARAREGSHAPPRDESPDQPGMFGI